MSFQMSQTESDLSDVGYEVGAVAETNPHWLAGLARLVEATGKSVNELTIGELRSLIQQRAETYNRIYADFEGRGAMSCQM